MIALEEDQRIIKDRIAIEAGKGRFAHKKVLIFGCTIYAREIREALQGQGGSLEGILDNNPQKAGKTCLGVPVYLPEEYFSESHENTLVILCSKYHREMAEQLKKLGCTSDNWINILVKESKKREEDSMENFLLRMDQTKEGYRSYREIQEKHGGEPWLFLCPYPGTGDIYMACMYLDAYLGQEKVQDYVMVVTTESCKKTAALFRIPDIQKISQDKMEKILKAWEFLGTKKMKIKPLLYWGWRTKRYLYADEYSQITFNEMFLYDVFHLPENAKKKCPLIDRNSSYAKELFHRFRLKPHKTLIMAPYAGSFVSEMGMEVWEQVAEALARKGWTVATNCCGEREKPVAGTVPIWFPYEEAVNVLEYAGSFMALRSGLCDIVSQTKCRMIVLYESGFNAARYEYFSLRKMGLNQEAIEFVYEKNKERALTWELIKAVEKDEPDVCSK